MVGSEVGGNNVKVRIHFALYQHLQAGASGVTVFGYKKQFPTVCGCYA